MVKIDVHRWQRNIPRKLPYFTDPFMSIEEYETLLLMCKPNGVTVSCEEHRITNAIVYRSIWKRGLLIDILDVTFMRP